MHPTPDLLNMEPFHNLADKTDYLKGDQYDCSFIQYDAIILWFQTYWLSEEIILYNPNRHENNISGKITEIQKHEYKSQDLVEFDFFIECNFLNDSEYYTLVGCQKDYLWFQYSFKIGLFRIYKDIEFYV